MASFGTKKFTKHDDFMTPKYAWDNIKHFIPADAKIWESAYGDGKSGTYLKELGYDTFHKEIDYFTEEPTNFEWTHQITNCPFSIKKKWFTRAKQLNKPFIIICPTAVLTTQYFRLLFSNTDDKIQIIIPRTRIGFTKIVNGEVAEGYKGKEIKPPKPNFDCFYYCWKMNLPRDIMWLN